MKSCLSIAVLACTVTMSLTANAQEWLRDRRYREGVGIRAGNLELHPGVAAEAGYDSNFLQRADSENPLAFWRFRITPHLSLSTLSAQRRGEAATPPSVEFRASVSATGELLAPAEKGSEAEQAAEDQRDVSVDASFVADFFPKGRVGADLYGDFRRATEPSNQVDDALSFDRDALRLGAGAIWRPGGGVFDWRVGYEFRLNHFENAGYREFDNVHHYLKVRNRWRFLPRTALLHDSQLGAVRYTETGGELPNYQELRTQLGVNGLVTRRLGLLAMAGWGAAVFEDTAAPAEDFDSVIGQAQVTWFVLAQPDLPNPGMTLGLSSIAAGYVRSFSQSYLTSYYVRDRGYLTLSYFFAGRVLAQLEGGYSYLTLPTVRDFGDGTVLHPNPPVGGDWNQHRIDGAAFVEYRIADSFGINGTVRYDANLSTRDQEISVGGTATDDLSFERYQAFLGLRWFM
jgi:hypothetical protein